MIPEKLFRDHNTFIHVNPNEKIIILTTLRTASSFCERILTEETGWLPRSTIEGMGLDKLLEYHNQGFQFNAVLKEPWTRLTSAMEIVVPKVHTSILTAPEIQQYFARSISLIVHKFGPDDIAKFGALNYNCNDAHMAWGTHTTAMFLEAVGVPVKPLLLDNSDSIPDYSPQRVESFNKFLGNLEFADYKSVIDLQEHSVENSDQIAFRSNRYMAWLQCCTRVIDNDGSLCIPTYSVHDWINHDSLLFNNFLNINVLDVDRQVVARKVIAGIIKDMWQKLNIREIALNQRFQKMVYPWDTMFNLLGTFKDYRDRLPEFYDDRWHRSLFNNDTRMSRQYPVPQSTPHNGNITTSTWHERSNNNFRERQL